MDYKDINILLQKYLAGRTSLVEEKYLREFFLKNKEVPDELSEYRFMFDYYNIESSKKFQSKISIPDKCIKNRFINNKLFHYSGIAASIVIFITVVLVFAYPKEKHVYAYVDGKAVVDKRQAMEETIKALLVISNNYNRATENLNYLKVFNEVTEQVTKKY